MVGPAGSKPCSHAGRAAVSRQPSVGRTPEVFSSVIALPKVGSASLLFFKARPGLSLPTSLDIRSKASSQNCART